MILTRIVKTIQTRLYINSGIKEEGFMWDSHSLPEQRKVRTLPSWKMSVLELLDAVQSVLREVIEGSCLM